MDTFPVHEEKFTGQENMKEQTDAERSLPPAAIKAANHFLRVINKVKTTRLLKVQPKFIVAV